MNLESISRRLSVSDEVPRQPGEQVGEICPLNYHAWHDLCMMPPGTAEDDRVLPTTKNPYFIENYFAIFRNPPTPNALKWMKSRKFFTNFEKNIEIPMNFHQNQCEKRRIWFKNVDFFEKISKISDELL